MNGRTRSLSFLVAALFLAALALAVPESTRAMQACKEGGCTYIAGGTSTDEAHCGPFDTHCHCFLNANPESHQHQTACNAIPGGGGN
jgi:hypothetical protein